MWLEKRQSKQFLDKKKEKGWGKEEESNVYNVGVTHHAIEVCLTHPKHTFHVCIYNAHIYLSPPLASLFYFFSNLSFCLHGYVESYMCVSPRTKETRRLGGRYMLAVTILVATMNPMNTLHFCFFCCCFLAVGGFIYHYCCCDCCCVAKRAESPRCTPRARKGTQGRQTMECCCVFVFLF